MDDEIRIKMENFYIRYLYDHWAENSEFDPVTADEVVSEVQYIKDKAFGQRIIRQMKELRPSTSYPT